ncbi:MAG: hypothetical protein OHK0047_43990 [Leptolyngbyaceae cyanobacterium]|uniref:hypothetical protein n=1 Tax=Leptodesmis sp. TaxID=3100501 RepID=UPI003D0E1646
MIGNFGIEDWFNRGKEDAWLGRSKCPPDLDPEAASLYDLGYNEGAIERSPETLQPQDQPAGNPAVAHPSDKSTNN